MNNFPKLSEMIKKVNEFRINDTKRQFEEYKLELEIKRHIIEDNL